MGCIDADSPMHEIDEHLSNLGRTQDIWTILVELTIAKRKQRQERWKVLDNRLDLHADYYRDLEQLDAKVNADLHAHQRAMDTLDEERKSAKRVWADLQTNERDAQAKRLCARETASGLQELVSLADGILVEPPAGSRRI